MNSKSKYNKGIGKKILALFLSMLTVISCFMGLGLNANATDVSYWNGHTRLSNGGKDAFCINYGQAAP